MSTRKNKSLIKSFRMIKVMMEHRLETGVAVRSFRTYNELTVSQILRESEHKEVSQSPIKSSQKIGSSSTPRPRYITLVHIPKRCSTIPKGLARHANSRFAQNCQKLKNNLYSLQLKNE